MSTYEVLSLLFLGGTFLVALLAYIEKMATAIPLALDGGLR